MILVGSQTGQFLKLCLCPWLNISGVDVPVVLINIDRRARQSHQPVTLYLTVIVSPDTTSYPVLAVDATNVQTTEVSVSPPGEAAISVTQDSSNTTRSTGATDSETHTPLTDRFLSTAMPPVADQQAGMPPVEISLNMAAEAIATINLSDTWEDALGRIKWVMDTVSPVAEVRRDLLSADLCR